ncbi:hypothetical protein AAG906_005487 [Vitis piasezkii]
MEELRNDAYINSKVAKQRMKKWHDQLISNKELRKGQRVLLYDSRLHIFLGKLKSRWIGADSCHSGPTHCHPEADSASIGSTSAPEHAIASSSGASYRRDKRITWRHSGGTTSSLFFNCFCHIGDNVPFGWGELRKEVFVINAKLFW